MAGGGENPRVVEVRTKAGALRGTIEDGVAVVRGIPFAEAARVAPGTQVRVLTQGETLTIDPIGRPA